MYLQQFENGAYRRIIGIDESGVGELIAYPVVAAVALPVSALSALIAVFADFINKDPKRLTAEARADLFQRFKDAQLGRAVFQVVDNMLFLEWNQFDVLDVYTIRCLETFVPLTADDLVLVDGDALGKGRHRDHSSGESLLKKYLDNSSCDYHNHRGLDRSHPAVQFAGLIAQVYRNRLFDEFCTAHILQTSQGAIGCGSGNAGDKRTLRWLELWLKHELRAAKIKNRAIELPPIIKLHFSTFANIATKAGFRPPPRRKRDDVKQLLEIVLGSFKERAEVDGQD